MTIPAGVAASISARSFCLSGRSSGALSWTKVASATASARVATTPRLSRLAPSARPSEVSAGQAASTSRRSFASASGAGSQARTWKPWARKCATQPPPITPAPTHATVSGMDALLQAEDLAGAGSACHGGAEVLHDPDGALNELPVGRLLTHRQVEVVLEPDPDVPAEQHRLRDPRHLVPPDGERRPLRAVGEQPQHGLQQPGVDGRAVGDAQAELEERGSVDQAFFDHFGREPEVTGVEDLQLRLA